MPDPESSWSNRFSFSRSAAFFGISDSLSLLSSTAGRLAGAALMGPPEVLSVSSSEESETAFFLAGLLAASGAESSLEASSSTSFLLEAVDL